jgi:hypothetical protein
VFTQPSPFGFQFDVNVSPNTTEENVTETTTVVLKNLEVIAIVKNDVAKFENLQN